MAEIERVLEKVGDIGQGNFENAKNVLFGPPWGGLMAFWLQKGTFIVGVLAAHSLKIWKKSDDNYYFLAFTEN